MIVLNGNSVCKLDDKYRLSMPTKLMRQLEGVNDMDIFIVKPSVELPCIELYPKGNWDMVQGELARLDRFRPETQRFLLLYLRDHQLIRLDRSNRLLLPAGLLELAQIKKDVVLAPIIDHIQIWDEELYAQHTKALPDDYYNITTVALDKRNG